MKRTAIEIAAIAFLLIAVAGIVLPSYLRRTRARQELRPDATELPVAPSSLLKQLSDPTKRLEAIRQLGRLKDREAAQFIPPLLADDDPDVRRACVWALGEIADPKSSPHIRWRLSDRDLGVRIAAAEALAKAPDPEGIKELVGLLRAPEAELRQAVKEALLHIGAPALEALDAAVHAPVGGDVRLALVELAAAIGGEAAVPTLVKLLTTADPVSRERRDTKQDGAVREAAISALARLGAPAAQALGRQLSSQRGSLEHKKALAEAFKRLGKPAIAPVANHILAWKVFPREKELRLWADVLQTIGKGDAQAEAALARANAQLASRADIGVAPPPSNPAELRIVEVPDLTPYSPVELPPVPNDLPANGQVKLLLRNALIGARRSGEPSTSLGPGPPGHTLELNLLRHRGQWLNEFWGKATTYNQGDHEGEIVESRDGTPIRLAIQVAIADENWIQGGFASYKVELTKAAQGYTGSHRGRFNCHDVEGEVDVVLQDWPEGAFAAWSVEPGEHPRLLFRKSQLPKMRQRAGTELGRAILNALRDKVAEDEQHLDHAIGWALLGLLLDDPAWSRQAIRVLRHGMKSFAIGHQHDSARKMLLVALAYDLAYPAMTGAEVKEFNDYVIKEGQVLSRFGLGNNCLSANSNSCAISFGPAVMIALAGLREKGPFDLPPPKEGPPTADQGQRQGFLERYQWERRRWEAMKAEHAKTGEAPQVPLGLTTSSRYVNLWFTHAIGDHAWKTEPEGYTMIALDMVLPAASAYPAVTGRPIVCGSGLPWVVPVQLMRTCSSAGGGYSGSDAPFSVRHLCYATHLSRPELQPALVWEFHRRLLPDKLSMLSCHELAFALACFPLDVSPRPPEEVMPKVIADRRKGAFVFRNHYNDFVGRPPAPRESGDIVATVFFRSERPYGETHFHPQAGSFRISGLGTAWANGIIGNKRDWDYADEIVLHIEGSNGEGLGRVTYFAHKPDGSGVVGADMSDVYNRGTGLGVQAERHFAVDYSGASGAPALFAVVDRVKGGGKKSWRLHTEGRSIAVNGASFTIQGRLGGTLQGRFVAPERIHLAAAGGTLSAISEAPEADFLVVMTIQKGPAPEIKPEGAGIEAIVAVGGQIVRFENGRLVLSRQTQIR